MADMWKPALQMINKADLEMMLKNSQERDIRMKKRKADIVRKEMEMMDKQAEEDARKQHKKKKKIAETEMQKQTVENADVHFDCSAMEILENVELDKMKREQNSTVKDLEKIHLRVKAALVHFGINPDLHMSQTQMMSEAAITNRPPGFTTKERRERILYQRSIMDLMHEYTQICVRRNSLMDEVGFWMVETNEALEKDMKAEAELLHQEQNEREIHRAMRSAILTAENSAKKIKRLGKVIFQEVQDEGESLKVLASKQNTEYARPAMENNGGAAEDTSILGDAENWKSASQEVKQALNEAIKTAKNTKIKNTAKQGLKQFNFICVAIDKRNREVAQFGQEILDYQLKINQMTKANERLTHERDRLKMSCDDGNMRMDILKVKLEETEKKNKELQAYIAAFEDGSLFKRASAVSISPTPEPPEIDLTQDELTRLRNENEALKNTTHDLKKESKQIKDRLSKLSMQISKLQNTLIMEQEKYKQLEKQMELQKKTISQRKNESSVEMKDQLKKEKELQDKVKGFEKDVALLRTEVNGKNEIIEFQEKRLKEVMAEHNQMQTSNIRGRRSTGKSQGQVQVNMESDDPSVKQMFNRMKADYEAELHRLQEHVLKETQRCQAKLRKQEQELNVRIQGIHKECLHLFRAVNRFKESLAGIFDREGLLDLSHELKTNVKDLPMDELQLPQDTKSMMSTVSGLAIELMVALEFKVSQAMINKRIELKEGQLAKRGSHIDVDDDHPTQDSRVLRARQQIEQLTEKLNKSKEEVGTFEILLAETKRISEEKYQSLLERYKNMIISSNTTQRELAVVRKEMTDEIKNRDVQLQHLRVAMAQLGHTHDQALKKLKQNSRHAKSKIMMANRGMQDQRIDVENIKLSLQDQKKNLDILGDALKNNKISEDLHMITMQVIKRSMDIPIVCLRNLFERYIQHKKFKDNHDILKKQLNKTTGAEHWELRQFIENMEKKMQTVNQRWLERTDQLKQERTKLYEQMQAIFETVHEESGILLVKPVLVYSTNKKNMIVPGSSKKRSVAMQVYLKGVRADTVSPSALFGTQVNLIGDRGPYWKIPSSDTEESPAAMVTTPKMLELDVNRDRRKAKKTLGVPQSMGDNKGQCRLPPLATFLVTESPFEHVPHREEEWDKWY